MCKKLEYLQQATHPKLTYGMHVIWAAWKHTKKGSQPHKPSLRVFTENRLPSSVTLPMFWSKQKCNCRSQPQSSLFLHLQFRESHLLDRILPGGSAMTIALNCLEILRSLCNVTTSFVNKPRDLIDLPGTT